MLRYTVMVECPDVVQDKFAVGCAIGRLIDNNGWEVIRTYRDDKVKAAITMLGFDRETGAAKACALIDDEGIAGVTVYPTEITKSLE